MNSIWSWSRAMLCLLRLTKGNKIHLSVPLILTNNILLYNYLQFYGGDMCWSISWLGELQNIIIL